MIPVPWDIVSQRINEGYNLIHKREEYLMRSKLNKAQKVVLRIVKQATLDQLSKYPKHYIENRVKARTGYNQLPPEYKVAIKEADALIRTVCK